MQTYNNGTSIPNNLIVFWKYVSVNNIYYYKKLVRAVLGNNSFDKLMIFLLEKSNIIKNSRRLKISLDTASPK
jgi:hypothetical protein